MAQFVSESPLKDLIAALSKLQGKGASGNYFAIRIEDPIKGHIYMLIPASAIGLLMSWGVSYPIHEIAIKQTRCLFLDVDYSAIDRSYEHLKKNMLEFVKHTRQILEYYVKFIIMESNRDDKISLHVICPNLVFATIQDMVDFVGPIVNKLDYDIRRFFDTAPYRKNAQLRIIGTNKGGVPLSLASWSDIPEEETDYYMSTPSALGIEYVRRVHPDLRVLGDIDAVETISGAVYRENITASGLSDKVIRILDDMSNGHWRMRPNSNVVEFPEGWDCPIHNRHHDADNGSISLKPRGFYLRCFRRDSADDNGFKFYSTVSDE